ncbi:MAG TPA: LLM class flavin-dependent oxidoreductase, partial [Ktedonobacterales bacterium]|nr:LLM class flavin-dependent oxidoreductase [Ktedonobacterales bacterium]
DYPELRVRLDTASTKAGRRAGSAQIAPYITTAIVMDEREREVARRKARQPVAFYVGRMGTFYAEMLSNHGFAEDVAAIKKGWEQGQAGALEAVSDRLLDATAIVGTPAEIVARLREWQALGVDEPLISLPPGGPDEAGPRLEAVAREAGLS